MAAGIGKVDEIKGALTLFEKGCRIQPIATQGNEMAQFEIIEKKNPLAVHAHCETRESAQRWIDEKAPEYCAKGYFMDKTLTPESFEIKPIKG